MILVLMSIRMLMVFSEDDVDGDVGEDDVNPSEVTTNYYYIEQCYVEMFQIDLDLKSSSRVSIFVFIELKNKC